MPSFDTVLEPDLVELRNAVEQANKEIGTRFDFKGSDARVELADKGKERTLTLFADSDFQIGQVRDVLLAKLSKRGVDVRFLDLSTKLEKLGGDKYKQVVPVKTGIDSEPGKAHPGPDQAEQAQGAGFDPGRRGAHQWCQARRSAKRHRAAEA